MLSRFASDFVIRFGASAEQCSGQLAVNGLLNSHEPGYFIGPHTDVPNRVATCIFYCPDDNSLEEIGTRIYRPKRADYHSDIPHGEFEDFDLISVTPYRRNSALLFLRTDTSYHGVEPLKDEHFEQSDRLVIQYMVVDRRPGALQKRRPKTDGALTAAERN